MTEDLENNVEEINKLISQLLNSQMNELSTQFESIKQRITNNLQKLYLGSVKVTIDKFIENILKESLEKLKENNTLRLNRIKGEVNKKLDEIFSLISQTIKSKLK